MAETIEQFLSRIKLEEYICNFKEKGVNDFNSISDGILQNIGVKKIGHRKRILTELNANLATAGQLIDEETMSCELNSTVNKSLSLPPRPIPQPRVSSIKKPKEKPVKPPRIASSFKKVKIESIDAFNSNLYHENNQTQKLPPIPIRSDLINKEEESVTTPYAESKKILFGSLGDGEEPYSQRVGGYDSLLVSLKKSDIQVSQEKVKVSESENDVFNIIEPPKHAQDFRERSKTSNQEFSQKSGKELHRSFTLSPTSNCNEIEFITARQNVTEEFEDDSDDEISFDDLVLPEDDYIPPENLRVLSMVRDKESFIKCVDGATKDVKFKLENRKSRFSNGKSGYLSKKGGQKGDKSVRRRWVEFDGNELRYFKDKGTYLKQTIPVARMVDVEFEKNAKKPTFHLCTPNRKFTFIESSGNMNELCMWMSVLREAILLKELTNNDECTVGGKMSNPDIEGWLLKQGHDLRKDFKDRYVAIKGGLFCYYYTFQDFCEDLPICCLELKLVSVKEDSTKLRLLLHSHTQKVYIFEAPNEMSYSQWKRAINTGIQVGLGSCECLKQLQKNKSNNHCADCDANNPIWASVNLLVVVCIECIASHRSMGAQISKARSTTMDEKVWSPSLINLFQVVGNLTANSLWAGKLPADDKINPDSNREARDDFIYGKYKDKKYFMWSEKFGQPHELGMAIRETVVTENVLETLRLIVSGADIYYIPEESVDQRTPYELAKDAGMNLQVELLMQYQGHLTLEEREYESVSLEELKKEIDIITPATAVDSSSYEKSGLLLTKLTRNDVWKEKIFMLQGRKLWYHKGPKQDDHEIIDLSKIEEMEFCEEDLIFNLTVAKRLYFAKCFTLEDLHSWHKAIHFKQVMNVPIELQDVSSNKIPYLVEKCVTYIDAHALRVEGIYRHSGRHTTIKKLMMLFNQDASHMVLTLEECIDVHAVASLLKQFLRQLPEPLLTNQLYSEFIANSSVAEENHETKMYRYQELLNSLPAVNYDVFRYLVLHLTQVIKESEKNKMNLHNISILFGPILLSGGNTLEQNLLNKEYAVLTDILTYFKWLFNVDEVELKKLESVQDAFKKLHEAQEEVERIKSQGSVQFNSMQVTIHVGNNEDQMKMTNSTTPSDVCMYCIKKHQLSVDGNWALFEVMPDEQSERPVHFKESVLQLAMSVGDHKLKVKENYVAAKIAPFQFSSLGLNGYLHFSKNDGRSWKKGCFVEVKTGNVKVYAKKGSSKEEDNIPIHETLLFIGMVGKKKPPGRFGFSMVIKDGDRTELRHFSTDNEVEIDMFIAAIFSIRYPTGLWTPLNASNDDQQKGDEPVTLSQNYWGRQSTFLRPRGASMRMLNQLHLKRSALRNVFNR